MAKLTYLFIHCAYTPPKLKLTPDHILQWHLKDNGWSRPGYSDIILRDGSLHNLFPYNQDDEVDNNEMTWGVKGVNGISRHVCIEGGKDDDRHDESPLMRHPEIVSTLRTYISYAILRHPSIQVCGHYQFDDKKPFCPGFNVPEFLTGGTNEKNIFNNR